MVMSGALAGAGNTIAAMSLSILSFWILRFPVAWVLAVPGELGPDGIFWSFPISNIMAGVVAVGWFLRGTWIRRVVDDDAVLLEVVREQAIVEEGLGEG
jgi:Na+-driven multidrug efflux pump